MIASVHPDGTIRLWNFSGSLLKILNQPKPDAQIYPAYKVIFNHRGTQLASAHSDGSVKIWDVEKQILLKNLTDENKQLTFFTVAFSFNDQMIAAGSDDRSIKLWLLENSKEEVDKPFLVLNGHEALIRSVIFINNDELIASGSDDYTLRVWETKSSLHSWNKTALNSEIAEIKKEECERFEDYMTTNETGQKNQTICD